MKKLRTNLRRAYIISLLILGRLLPVEYTVCGAVLVVVGSALHFIASGYLAKERILISSGPYACVRNPFYVSNIMIDIGLGLLLFNAYVVFPFLLLFYLLVIPYRTGLEEKTLNKIFGEEYEEFKAHVHRFIPFVKTMPKVLRKGYFSAGNLIKNQEVPRVLNHLNLIALCISVGLIKQGDFRPMEALFVIISVVIYVEASLFRRYLKRVKARFTQYHFSRPPHMRQLQCAKSGAGRTTERPSGSAITE